MNYYLYNNCVQIIYLNLYCIIITKTLVCINRNNSMYQNMLHYCMIKTKPLKSSIFKTFFFLLT